VPRNKLGSAHPLDSKWQITSYLLYWVCNRIFWGAPLGRCSSRREREAARSVDAGASHPSPPLTWRIGMTAPVIERAGAVSLRKRKARRLAGRIENIPNVMKREHLRSA
jgi:hypothetical protein